MQKSVILLPTYNERENVGVIIPEIFAAHPDIRVLVIDDNSPDGTGDVVKELKNRYPNLNLLSRPKKEGLGVAYRDGIKRVLEDTAVQKVILMDADGSHDVRYIKDMLALSDTHDLVIGSRYIKGGGIEKWEAWRVALSRWGNIYAWILTGLPVRDLTSGFQCFRADVFSKMDLDHVRASGYAFQIDMKYHAIRDAKASVVEIPILFRTRRGGESKMTRHIIREGLTTPLRLFRKRMLGI